MSLLSARHICKSYPIKNYQFAKDDSFDAIKNISFDLEAGKTLAIVGESGSGKSTLARQIIGIEKPTFGEVIFNGERLHFSSIKNKKMRFKNIRMIFQNPYESLNPQARIGTTLEEVLRINTNLSNKQRKEKVANTLSRVGLLPEHQHRYPHMFSGGQRQRIAIARAIILEPQVIIADEPLSALDVSIQAQILNLLQELQEEMQISYLFISHDLNVVEHIADEVMVMYRGEIVEYGSIEQIFDQPKHPYTQTLFASTPMYRKRFKEFEKPDFKTKKGLKEQGCCFAQRCHFCEPHCQSKPPQLIAQEDGYKIACFKAE
ncbi:dipeptide ABC transporter ATP-binding protein [Aliikangiella sp. IMCC44359]|uniref:dipeptide ABC transporter ATP-binding protein n=1 Tax=Aliikangiella sp. IMCC44359 TaxID=3459125 RepID=UPI00403AAF08